MHTVLQNKKRFTINKEALIFAHCLVHEFLCGAKHMGTPVQKFNQNFSVASKKTSMLILATEMANIKV